MRIEDFIEASNKATSIDELFTIYKNAMAKIGFDRLIFSLMTDHVNIKRCAGHGIMLNYPEDWMKHYSKNHYDVFDPVRCKMYSSDGVFIWQNLLNSSTLTKNQIKCLKQGEDAGLHDGIGIPLRGSYGAIAGIGAASSKGGIDLHKNILSYTNMLSYQFYTVFLELEKAKDVPEVIVLTDREQEILQWCAKAKTKSEIGYIMNLSEHTVDYHLRKVFQKFKANNISIVILKALHMGLIQL